MATERGVPDPLIKRGGGRGERGGVVEHLSTSITLVPFIYFLKDIFQIYVKTIIRHFLATEFGS